MLSDVHSNMGTLWRAMDVGCTGAACVSCMHAASSAIIQVSQACVVDQVRCCSASLQNCAIFRLASANKLVQLGQVLAVVLMRLLWFV